MTVSIDMPSLKDDWGTGICLRPLAAKHGISTGTARKYLNKAGIDTGSRSCFTKPVWDLIQSLNKILDEYDTRLTVRQTYYQAATRGIVTLTNKGYNSVKSALNKGRKKGYIPWEKIEDRTRQPHTPPSWDNVGDYFNTLRYAYRKDTWQYQPHYFEVWLEKNALYGILWPICNKYNVTLQTITGYSSVSAIYDGSKRFMSHTHSLLDGKRVSKISSRDFDRVELSKSTILYFGDHDATDIDIDRAIKDGFKDDHNLDVDVKRIGLLYSDMENLPSNPIKEDDPRAANYPYEKQVELDALDPKVLIERLESAIISHLDITEFNRCINESQTELHTIQSIIDRVQKGE